MEAEGLVLRTVLSDTPPHVEYRLTDAGQSLAPALQALYDGGEQRAAKKGLTIDTATS